MKRIIVFITTYERPEMLLNLLKQIKKQSSNFDIKIYINNDCSQANYTKVTSYLKRYFDDFHYILDNEHRGKLNYWHIINRFYQFAKQDKFDYFIQVPDDIQLVDDFFNRATAKYDAINDSDKACLNILNDYGRNGMAVWVPVKPEVLSFKNFTYIRNGWMDMAYICTKHYFDILEYTINKVSPNWSGKPGRSSGVGMQISQRLYKSGASIYQVAHSLIIHGAHESVMHPEERKLHPLITNHQKDKVIASMATMPCRVNSLFETVNSLLPQVTELHVYLNEFDNVPAFLNNPKIKVYRSQDEVGDLGDVGKFYTAAKIKGYHFTVDDDLIYPADYVSTLIEQIEKHNRKYIVGLHGRIFDKFPIKSYYYDHEQAFSCLRSVLSNVFVHVTGTGACAYHTDTFNISVDCFKTMNMSDIWFSKKANDDNISLLVLKHERGWIRESKKYNRAETIYNNCNRIDTVQTDIMNKTQWRKLR